MLIPRAHLFGNPTRAAARISPDGTMLSWLAPVDGVLNVFVSPADAPGDAVAVTRDRGRGVRIYGWTYAGGLVFLQDVGGDARGARTSRSAHVNCRCSHRPCSARPRRSNLFAVSNLRQIKPGSRSALSAYLGVGWPAWGTRPNPCDHRTGHRGRTTRNHHRCFRRRGFLDLRSWADDVATHSQPGPHAA
jgi:hypothetical protein